VEDRDPFRQLGFGDGEARVVALAISGHVEHAGVSEISNLHLN